MKTVCVDGAWIQRIFYQSGFINKEGEEVIPFKYDDARSFSEGLAAVHLIGWKFIDNNNEVVFSMQDYNFIDWVGDFHEGLAVFHETGSRLNANGKLGYVNKKGEKVIPAKYDVAMDFSEGLAKVKIENKYGFVDKEGKEVIPLKYDDAGNFSEGLAKVKLNGKEGYIDKNGTEYFEE
ncbi:MAG: WG repeat-containing protein [Ignavibacteriae bacterium]|nr:WG repeat-containing protein [Ignavibacteriota bacterium]